MLYSGVDYDDVSNNGYYTRLKENEFIVWGRTVADEKREFRYRSLIVMPGRTLKFKGKECPKECISFFFFTGNDKSDWLILLQIFWLCMCY